jgi:hypothetical protein
LEEAFFDGDLAFFGVVAVVVAAAAAAGRALDAQPLGVQRLERLELLLERGVGRHPRRRPRRRARWRDETMMQRVP